MARHVRAQPSSSGVSTCAFAHRTSIHVLAIFARRALLIADDVVPFATRRAQAPGVRGGVSVDPDQFYLGGHYETGPLVDRLHFKPNLELGFGDDLTHFGDQLRVRLQDSCTARPWTLYAGGGPAINFYSFDDIDDSETEPGFNVLFGAETRRTGCSSRSSSARSTRPI